MKCIQNDQVTNPAKESHFAELKFSQLKDEPRKRAPMTLGVYHSEKVSQKLPEAMEVGAEVMPDEKKLCTACKLQLPRSCFSKKQWDDEEERKVPRRCSECIRAKRGDPQKLRDLVIRQEKFALQQEEERKLWTQPDTSQMDRRCASCGKWEGDQVAEVTFITCPFCARTYPSQQTKLCVCLKDDTCYETAIRNHFNT